MTWGTLPDVVVALMAIAAVMISLASRKEVKRQPVREHQRRLRDELRLRTDDVLSAMGEVRRKLSSGEDVGKPSPTLQSFLDCAKSLNSRLTDVSVAAELELAEVKCLSVELRWSGLRHRESRWHLHDERHEEAVRRQTPGTPSLASEHKRQRAKAARERDAAQDELRAKIAEAEPTLNKLRQSLIDLDKSA